MYNIYTYSLEKVKTKYGYIFICMWCITSIKFKQLFLFLISKKSPFAKMGIKLAIFFVFWQLSKVFDIAEEAVRGPFCSTKHLIRCMPLELQR